MVEHTAEIIDIGLAKPELVIHYGDLPATAEALRDVIARSGQFFDRGVPVRIVRSVTDGSPAAIPLTRHSVVISAHRLCRPIRLKQDGTRIDATLPDRVAQMYLDMVGEWNLRPLHGVTSAPILFADGSVRTADGYDRCFVAPFRRSPCRIALHAGTLSLP
jgi:prepilin-type processing-associated H-X9-DG protein